LERPNEPYTETYKNLRRYVPGFLRAERWFTSLLFDNEFTAFYENEGAKVRLTNANASMEYMKKNTPEKYKSFLLPNYVIGAKRRVLDTDYLKTLHKPNVHLSNQPILQVKEHSIVTAEGEIEVDVIVNATGFKTQEVLMPLVLKGQNGDELAKRWKRQGGARAYLGTQVPNFPNFFMLIGPNTVQGHYSVIYTSEVAVNYAIKLLRPLFKDQKAKSVVVKQDAEDTYNQWLSKELKRTIWTPTVDSWYIDKKTHHNPMIFPNYQTYFWLITIFPKWRDFKYEGGTWFYLNKRRLLTLVGLVYVLLGARQRRETPLTFLRGRMYDVVRALRQIRVR